MPQELRAVDWTGDSLALIDQTVLPHRTETVEIRDVDSLVSAVRRLVVRGAPAIGAAGAYGVALAILEGEREGWSAEEVRAAVARVREARPTAVNLMVCVDRVMTRFDEGLDSAVMGRLHALVPGAYSRLGAAIRHGTTQLIARGGTARRLLVLLSDGLAYDHGYEPAYGAADARKALAEARREGVGCVCLSVGAGTDTQVLRRVFGSAAFATAASSHFTGLGRFAAGFTAASRRRTCSHPQNVW